MESNRRNFVARALLGSGAAALSGTGALASLSGAPSARAQSGGQGAGAYHRIATEAAFATPEQLEGMRAVASTNWGNADVPAWRNYLLNPRVKIHQDLIDIGEQRIEAMDANGVAMQVLSLTSPGVQMFDAATATAVAQTANDRLAEAIGRHPTRFAGLASFAPQDPERAAQEMDRAINKLKLNGFVVNSHTQNEYLDNTRFWPILEAAEALDRPIYVHPRAPADVMSKPYADYGMALAIWGFQAEVGVHVVRMILGGVFDKFPDLKIVIGHMGESVPYNLWRLDHMYTVMTRSGIVQIPAKMKPSEVFNRNFTITTSGVEHGPALRYCIEVLGADKIMWAIDYPYQQSAPAVAFMNEVDIAHGDRVKIYQTNAERVFGLV